MHRLFTSRPRWRTCGQDKYPNEISHPLILFPLIINMFAKAAPPVVNKF